MKRAFSLFLVAVCLTATPSTRASAQPHPPLEDFVALASKDAKISEAAASRLAPLWRNSYSAMILDLARFFRPAREAGPAIVAEDSLGGDEDPQTGRTARGGPEPFTVGRQTPESQIRDRLMRFLKKRTGRSFGNDLKLWRKWSWSLPEDPHPQYAAFKARLYANVDARMATFFEAPTKPRIRLDEIDWGGVGVNGIPPLDQPKVVRAEEAGFMGEKNVVFGLVVNGEARAYPKRILAWHEMALDTVGGVKLAIVYCTLCGTVIPYEATASGRSFTFGTSGLLYWSNKLMFDLETKSLWSTLEGRPVLGPLSESDVVLKYRPVVSTTWKEWRAAHPDTTVLSLDTGHRRDYDEGKAYAAYFSHDDLMFEVPGQDTRLKRKAEVVTFFAGDDRTLTPVAIDAAFLKKNPAHVFTVEGTGYVALTTEGGANRIYRSGEGRFVRFSGGQAQDDRGRVFEVREDRLEGPDGIVLARVPARRTFWFAWFAQFPQTLLIK